MFKNMSKPQKVASFASSVTGTFEEFVLSVASGDPPFKIQTAKEDTGEGPNFMSDALHLIIPFKF